MLEHGGRRRAAARRHGIPEADWLDLSTGINPLGYPVPPIPAEDWLRLPEDDDGLLDAARAYYGTPRLLALAGSQPAIQALPALLPRGRVAILAPGYSEHRHRWARAGHAVESFAAARLQEAATQANAVVLAAPNNPDATRFAAADLRAAAALADRAWQDATRARLATGRGRLLDLIGAVAGTPRIAGLPPTATDLFAWWPTPHAAAIADLLARRAILVRHFAPADGGGLRFGQPGDEAGWARLADALRHLPAGLCR